MSGEKKGGEAEQGHREDRKEDHPPLEEEGEDHPLEIVHGGGTPPQDDDFRARAPP